MKRIGYFAVILVVALLLVNAQVWAAPNEQEAIVSPKLTYFPSVVFSEAISTEYAGKQVTIRLRVSLSDSGAVNADTIQVVDSSGNEGIDQAVISAVKGAVFTPAYQSGHAVPITLLLPLKVEVPDNPPEAANPPKSQK